MELLSKGCRLKHMGGAQPLSDGAIKIGLPYFGMHKIVVQRLNYGTGEEALLPLLFLDTPIFHPPLTFLNHGAQDNLEKWENNRPVSPRHPALHSLAAPGSRPPEAHVRTER